MPNIDPKDIPDLLYKGFMDLFTGGGKDEKKKEWFCRRCTVVFEDDEAKENHFKCRLCGENLVRE